jgi:hypothetical protein
MGEFMGMFARLAATAATLGVLSEIASAQQRFPPPPAPPGDRVQVGTLACDISGGLGLIIGSQQTLNCSFRPSTPGPPEFYAGTLTKLGLSLGVTTGGVMIWAVYAPTSGPPGGLAGSYVGATAEATVGAGVGANVLIGGSNRTFALQPLSLQDQTGLNVAAGVAGIDLRWVR